MMNFQKMMQQAQDMQHKLQEMQEKLKEIEIHGEAGGGLVKVTMTCAGSMRRIDIDPSLIDPADKETLEDLVTAAVNNASEVKDARIQEETQKMMGGLDLPEGIGLPTGGTT